MGTLGHQITCQQCLTCAVNGQEQNNLAARMHGQARRVPRMGAFCHAGQQCQGFLGGRGIGLNKGGSKKTVSGRWVVGLLGLTLSHCPSISRGPRCAARRCLPSSSRACADLAYAQSMVFSSPVAGFSTTHMRGSKCAMILRALSTSTFVAGASSAHGCIPCRPGCPKPCRSAPTETSCSPSSGCRKGSWAQISTRSSETTSQPAASKALPTDLVPQKSSRRKALGVSAFLKSKITASATMKTRAFIGPDFFPRRIKSRSLHVQTNAIRHTRRRPPESCRAPCAPARPGGSPLWT